MPDRLTAPTAPTTCRGCGADMTARLDAARGRRGRPPVFCSTSCGARSSEYRQGYVAALRELATSAA